MDLYPNDQSVCPIRALKRYDLLKGKLDRNLPMFCDENGVPLTSRKLNLLLDKYINEKLGFTWKKLTTHSFRSGLVSLFGSLGVSESKLKDIGRWSSRAYLLYVKLGRSSRAEMNERFINYLKDI